MKTKSERKGRHGANNKKQATKEIKDEETLEMSTDSTSLNELPIQHRKIGGLRIRSIIVILLTSLVIVTSIVAIKAQEASRFSFESISGSREYEYFGRSTSISSNGEMIAVGGNGMAIVYAKLSDKGNPWVPELSLQGFFFGDEMTDHIRVALSSDGSKLMVSNPGSNINGDESGEVLVFIRKASRLWSKVGNSVSGNSFEKLGQYIAISDDGTRIAASTESSSVKLYDWEDGAWKLTRNFNGGNIFSMTSDGKKIAIADPAANSASGSVNIFDLTTYSIIDTIIGERNRLRLGSSVSLSNDGSTIALGLGSDVKVGDLIRQDKFSLITIYRQDPTTGKFSKFGLDIVGPGYSRFGSSLDLADDGNTVSVGAPRYDHRGDNRGVAFVYKIKDGRWSRIGKWFGKSKRTEFGWSLAMSGNGKEVIFGSPNYDAFGDNVGYVRVIQI